MPLELGQRVVNTGYGIVDLDEAEKGACCSLCGIQFAGQHGHAVLCRSCHKNGPANVQGQYPRATIKEL